MKNKEVLNKQKNKYCKIPTKLFGLGLHAYSISIFCYMSSVSENFNPSLKNIATHLKVSNPTVVKYIKELISKNIIEKYQAGGANRFTKYRFISPSEWKNG